MTDKAELTIPENEGALLAEQAAKAAREHIEQGRFVEAEQVVRDALRETQDPATWTRAHRDALYTLAVALRYQGRHGEALQRIGELLAIAPEYARAHQERGHVLTSLGRAGDAEAAFEQAVHHNPALLASWRALRDMYVRSGSEGRAALAAAEIEYLQSLPPELQAVASHLHEGRLYRADRLCRQFLRRDKLHVEGMRLLAAIGERLNVLLDAEFLLATCVELAPEHDRCRADYANVLLKMQQFEKATEQTSRLARRQPDNLAFMSLHASALAGLGDHEEAIALYDRVLARAPGQEALRVMRGHALKTIGKLEDAIASYRQAYQARADYGDAYWSLANIKTYAFTGDELAQMMRVEASDDVRADDRIHLCFALGKALEDQRDFESAFRYLERGNELKRRQVSYRPEHMTVRANAQKRVCTQAMLNERQDVGHPAPDPIFILGLPRAGSTLLEQILASHSKVDGTMELPHIGSLAQRLRGTGRQEEAGEEPRYPQILAELDHDYFRRFGEQFIEQTRVYRQAAPFFIDKHPNNFQHIGLIKLMLPSAKVIDARRHPLACCVGGFKQLFGQGQEFTYGLAEIGHYYREYVELMDHWDEVLPGFVLRVQHEEVVDDLEGQVRRVLDFCGLPFEQACVEYHRTERSVRTPSSEQVRQPIYREGLDAWRHFEPWLAPLTDALGPAVRKRYGID